MGEGIGRGISGLRIGNAVAALSLHDAGHVVPQRAPIEGGGDQGPLAGLFPGQEGHQDAGEHEVGRGGISKAGDGLHGEVSLVVPVHHGAASGPEGRHIEAGPGGVRALIAKAGEVTVNEPGEALLQTVIIQAHFDQGLQAHIGDEHIRVFQQLEQGLFSILLFQVQRNKFLVGVLGGEEGVFLCGIGNSVVLPQDPPLFSLQALHLDDVGSAVGHGAGHIRDRHMGPQLDYPEPDQRALSRFFVHMYPSISLRLSGLALF